MRTDEIMSGVVNAIVAQMEEGAGTWTMPWRGTFMPHNATTGIAYRGGNVVALWVQDLHHRYPTSAWATYKQWAEAGAQVRKGERGTHLVKWSPVEHMTASGDTQTRLIPRGFVVFNVAQVDNPPEQPAREVCTIDELERFFGAVPCQVMQGKPCYIPALDVIQMPPIESFITPEHYYATFAHECAHWTGHTDRLARDLSGRFGSDGYAMEELVAELSAAFTCALHDVDTVARLDHAAYLQSWTRTLKADPSVLWTVASQAQKATDHLLTYSTIKEPA